MAYQSIPAQNPIANKFQALQLTQPGVFNVRIKALDGNNPGLTASIQYTPFVVGVGGTRYISANSGNDANDGLTPQSAWKTAAKAAANQAPGRSFLFERGGTYTDNMEITSVNAPGDVARIDAYGSGTAPLFTGKVVVYNSGFCRVQNIRIDSNGVNKDCLIAYCDTNAGITYKNVIFDNVEVTNGNAFAIAIGNGNKDSFEDCVINLCTVHDTKEGIITYRAAGANRHKNIQITNCRAYRVTGTGLPEKNSGSGIIMGGTSYGYITNCEAYECGANNGAQHEGPLGIWLYDADHCLIEHCESHHNIRKYLDGGGFDIDGGCSYCTIQYCYSHDNQGMGYMMVKYPGSELMQNNLIRYCISENDDLKGGQGAIKLFGDIGENNAILHNTIILKAVPGATPSCVDTTTLVNKVQIENNIFYGVEGTMLVNDVTANGVYKNNAYYRNGLPLAIKFGSTTYNTLAEFRGTGNEANSLGSEANPQFFSGGNARLRYALRNASPLRVTATVNGQDGSVDYLGNLLPNTGRSVGAIQYFATASTSV
ncbi:right-handed parallel beta-helix repeat-containing protein [Hymenobacter sp. AT01-02]|uniref:right-handed parallel beta-helix repeat-containing protein n=1 Tax=Hymenobacter sp. AT01-02 TaxID=1571877 RepID=UPI0005F1A39E|nr:right-handed parallel beta-helix repeat-containing protein [Hymenobacter sp. AT01-02]